MKKEIWLLGLLGLIFVVLLGILILVPAKPSENNHGMEGLRIISPKINDEVSSPIKVTGVVSGNGWAGFEGQVGTVELVNGEGTTIMTAILQAKSEWTKLPTNFEANLDFSGYEGDAALVFHNENPSGDPQRDKRFVLPINILSSDTISVKVYFSSNSADSTCDYVVPVERVIPKTQAVAAAAVKELLKGPVDQEIGKYGTNIPAGSKLNSISIVNGEARVDFNAVTESGGGSCSMAARVAQITQTLLQFPTITSVKLSVDGRTGDIFQP